MDRKAFPHPSWCAHQSVPSRCRRHRLVLVFAAGIRCLKRCLRMTIFIAVTRSIIFSMCSAPKTPNHGCEMGRCQTQYMRQAIATAPPRTIGRALRRHWSCMTVAHLGISPSDRPIHLRSVRHHPLSQHLPQLSLCLILGFQPSQFVALGGFLTRFGQHLSVV